MRLRTGRTLARMRRLASPAWLLRHVVMIALVVTFMRLGWWQFRRAEGGNGLSIGYTLEWPAFSAFVIIVWLREVRTALRDGHEISPPARPAVAPETPAGVAQFDLLAARAARVARTSAAAQPTSEYNEYLAWLAAHPEARTVDYRPQHRTQDAGAVTEVTAVNEGVPAHE